MTAEFDPPPAYVLRFSEEGPYDDIEICDANAPYHRVIARVGLDDAPVADYNAAQRAHARMMAAAPQLARALAKALLVIDDLLPGLRYIALQDYKRLNEAPLDGKAALRAAGYPL